MRIIFLIFFLLLFSVDFKAQPTEYSEIFLKNLSCLELTVYHEARGESILGKTAVAMVVINRVKSSIFPDDVCSVVYQPYQFSWANKKLKRPIIPNQIKEVAFIVMTNPPVDPTNGSLYFHNSSVNRNVKHKVKIGNHIFR